MCLAADLLVVQSVGKKINRKNEHPPACAGGCGALWGTVSLSDGEGGVHEGVEGGEDAVSLHGIFAPQADLGAALHSVKGDAVDGRGFGVGLVAAVDIGTLDAAENDAQAVTLCDPV